MLRILPYLSILSLSMVIGCREHAKPPQLIFNKDFNWRIEIPEGFESVPPAEWKQIQARGDSAVETTFDVEVEDQGSSIFVFKSDEHNYFEANHQPYDSSAYSYEEQSTNVNAILYETFSSQMPGAVLDTVSSKETIDGKVFNTNKIKVTIPGNVSIEVFIFSRLFGNRELNVTITTIDKSKQAALLKAWRQSTFDSQ